MAEATKVYTEQGFIADIQEVFASSKDPVFQAHTIAERMRRLLATGWPQSSGKLGKDNGMVVLHADAEHGHPGPGFMVLAYRQGPSPVKTPSPHDHGTCFVVYGVASGSNTQTRYHWSHEGDSTELPVLEQGQEIIQMPGDADYFLPGEIHSTQGSTDEETIYVRVTSEDLDKVWRHRYRVGGSKAWAFQAASTPPAGD